jgi:hypothetical protein
MGVDLNFGTTTIEKFPEIDFATQLNFFSREINLRIVKNNRVGVRGEAR